MPHSVPAAPESRPALSASVPFQEVLRPRTTTAPASGTHDDDQTPKSPKKAVLPNMQPVHEQKGLSTAQSDGLKGVQDMLSKNNGGLRSGATLHPLPAPPQPDIAPSTSATPTIGPPSSKRSIARAVTLPEGIITRTAPVTGTVADLGGTPEPVSTPSVSTMGHYGMSAFVPTEPSKAETGLAMAKRTTKNLEVLADSSRATESKVERLELDVERLTIELRLRADTPWGERHENGSPSPSPTHGRTSVTSGDVDELFDRVEDVEKALADARTAGDDAVARIAVLERLAPKVVPDVITVAELSTAVALRFTDITSDRNVLNADIKYYAAKQDKINDELRSENKQLHATLAAMQATITRLTFASPAPLRPRSPSPILPRPRSRSPQAHLPRRQAPAHAAKVARSRSPTSDAPQKRQRVLHGKEGFLTMGPLRECQLSPLELFEKMVSDTLPTFTLTRPYTVIVDPVYPYHLRVTLDSVREAADLAQAWETGHHAVGVRVMLSDGCNESASNAGSSGHVQRNGGEGSGARRHTSTSSMRGRK